MKHILLLIRTIKYFHASIMSHESFMNLHCMQHRLRIWASDVNQYGRAPWMKICLSSTDGTLFIIGWTKTKRLSLLFSALFAHIVGRTKPECFNLFSESEVFVHLVLLSWTSIQLCHPAMRVSSIMHSALLWLPVNRLSATHSFTWLLAVMNM